VNSGEVEPLADEKRPPRSRYAYTRTTAGRWPVHPACRGAVPLSAWKTGWRAQPLF